MGIGPQLSSVTAPQETPKQGDGERRTSGLYLRQRKAMRAPLLPVRGMSMARGSGMLQHASSSTSSAQPRRRHSRKLPTDDLPPEAAALKRRIWDAHPGSVYKFRLDKMKRMVTPPVEIPPPLSDPTVMHHMVSGKLVPVTRFMQQQQRDLFKLKRLPSRIREGISY
jgi:hypothetical protein